MVHRTVQEAIRQNKPFRFLGQEAMVALLVTGDAVRRRLEAFFGKDGRVTAQQYNVLRILRGAEPKGLPTLAIAERMLERTPGVTRLLDRLQAKGLVLRQRGGDDRRQVVCRISRKGLSLLASLDQAVEALDDELTSCLGDRDLRQLIDLLDQLRMHQEQASG